MIDCPRTLVVDSRETNSGVKRRLESLLIPFEQAELTTGDFQHGAGQRIAGRSGRPSAFYGKPSQQRMGDGQGWPVLLDYQATGHYGGLHRQPQGAQPARTRFPETTPATQVDGQIITSRIFGGLHVCRKGEKSTKAVHPVKDSSCAATTGPEERLYPQGQQRSGRVKRGD